MREIIFYRIEELPRIPTIYLKKLANTDDIWEIRIILGRNIFRILGFFDGPTRMVLAHGFYKKTQKLSQRAIKLAEDRKRDYLQRRAKYERS